ncbi:hypothetical protein SEA_PHINKY_97 [Microbacterium phage Phinky]|nr:hypothetical protein SEA_PHINKY_97 [Microbacterium phage Phinky]
MTLSAATEVYLGRTARDELVFASVRIEPANPGEMVIFTDHATGPRPEEIAITFSLIQAYRGVDTNAGRRASDYPDNRWISGGQTSAEDRVLIGSVDPAVRIVEQAWARHHLNLMNAACEHMTDEMLTPSDDELTAYMEHALYGRRNALQKWRLDTVVCPVTGYRYGHAWLAKRVDPIEVEALRTAVAKLPKGVR